MGGRGHSLTCSLSFLLFILQPWRNSHARCGAVKRSRNFYGPGLRCWHAGGASPEPKWLLPIPDVGKGSHRAAGTKGETLKFPILNKLYVFLAQAPGITCAVLSVHRSTLKSGQDGVVWKMLPQAPACPWPGRNQVDRAILHPTPHGSYSQSNC